MFPSFLPYSLRFFVPCFLLPSLLRSCFLQSHPLFLVRSFLSLFKLSLLPSFLPPSLTPFLVHSSLFFFLSSLRSFVPLFTDSSLSSSLSLPSPPSSSSLSFPSFPSSHPSHLPRAFPRGQLGDGTAKSSADSGRAESARRGEGEASMLRVAKTLAAYYQNKIPRSISIVY